MDMLAHTLLQKAEQEDGYRSLCKRDTLNAKARNSTLYIPWHDQSDAKRYEQMIGDSSTHCVILHPSADGGMPHTRGSNVICIPAHWSESSIASTLRHELIHIDQKRNPSKWSARLLDEGWVSNVDVPAHIAQRCRINPDTIHNRFVAWEGRYVPLPLFEREDRPQLREIQVRWYDLEEAKIVMDPPASYQHRYGELSTSSKEHPLEALAYELQ